MSAVPFTAEEVHRLALIHERAEPWGFTDRARILDVLRDAARAVPVEGDRERLARAFHEAYERLAPSFGYETRRDSAVPWEDVPEPNRSLMIAVAGEVLAGASLTGSGLREAIEAAGFTPDDNVCGACGHHGGDHDLGNWCLKCPRPTLDGPHTFSQRIDAGWCYFSSENDEQRWDRSIKQVRAALSGESGEPKLITEEQRRIEQAFIDGSVEGSPIDHDGNPRPAGPWTGDPADYDGDEGR